MLFENVTNVDNDLLSEDVREQHILQEDFDTIVEWLRESGYTAENPDTYDIYSEAAYSTNKMAGRTRVMSKDQYFNLTKSMAALSAARSKNDADYQKLVKVSRLRKKLIAKLNKKYNSVAKKTAKAALKSAKKTSQAIVKTPAEGVSGTKNTPNKPKVEKK
jgi:hypothetical protein